MRKGERQLGVIAVELALVLPLLVWIILGVVDLGLMSREHQVVQNAAREGARFSSQLKGKIDANVNPGFTLADLRAVVVNYAAREGVTIAAGDVNVDQTHVITINGIATNASRITASKTYQFLTPGMASLLGTVNLVGEGIFKNLYA